MKNLAWSVIAVVGMVMLLLVGVLAGRVGGVAIRKQSSADSKVGLSLSEPIIRGVPVRIRWVVGQVGYGPVNIYYRDDGQEIQIGRALWRDGEAIIKVPCSVGEVGTLLIRQISDERIITNTAVELVPSGPECLIGASF